MNNKIFASGDHFMTQVYFTGIYLIKISQLKY